MKMKKRLFGILLSLALMFGLIPRMSLTALAYDGNPYAGLVNTTTTVMFNGIDWYIIADNSTAADAGTVTLLAKEPIAAESFSIGGSINTYSSSTVNSYLKGLVDGTSTFGESKSFKDVAGAINTVYIKDGENNIENVSSTSGEGYYGVKLYLLSSTEAIRIYQLSADILKCSKADGAEENVWWLRSPGDEDGNGNKDRYAACFICYNNAPFCSPSGRVDRKFGVRPALKLDLSSVVYSSESKSFSLRQTITAADVTATYGDTGKKITATTDGGGAISYTVKNGSENYIDVASDGKLTIKKVPADSKAYVTVTAAETATYAQATKEVTVTINKANAVTATVTANDRTYDGTEKPLVTVSGEATGGEMQYTLGTDATTAPTTGYTTSIPTATGAGTYYVWYMVKGDRIHSDTAATCIPVSIAPKETFTVTFDPGDGTGSMDPVQVTDGAAFTFPTSIFTAPSGHVFAHWIINDRHYAVGEQITVNSDLTVTAVWAPVDENNARTVTNTLTSVPASLSNLYSTVSELENALLYRLSVKGNIATRDNTEIFDVILQVLINGKWVEATPDNFPPGKLRATFPYPSGIDKNLYDFYVCHMFTVKMHGHEPGGTETPDVIKTEKGIQVDLDGLSPVAISWNKINTKALESLPQTGDNSLHPAVYGLIAALSILIIVFLIRRKR